MKRGQLIGIGVAGVAGLVAFMGMQAFVNQRPKTIIKKETVNAAEVLVASTNMGLGTVAEPTHFTWKKWPKDAVSPGYITRQANPMAIQDMVGGVARSMIMRDEPITDAKLVTAGKGGVLAAILPKGKRAISTKISDLSAAGRLILPNDHVDVLLTKRSRGRNGGENFVTDTLFRNVRVLAIGKKLDVEKKEHGADGPVATLELTPRQAEMLALANSMGEISLALRSIADINEESGEGNALGKRERSTAVKLLKYGVSGRAYGVN